MASGGTGRALARALGLPVAWGLLGVGIPAGCEAGQAGSSAGAESSSSPAPVIPAPVIPPAADLGQAPGTTSQEAPVSDPARLDWALSLSPTGDALLVQYTVTNTSDETIYLSDLMPISAQGGFALGDSFINVTAGGQPGEVRFVRGRLDSVAPVPIPLDPGARALDPGKSATGSATVKLPITAAHYHGVAAPIQGTPSSAVLEIGYVRGEVHWSPLKLADGRGLTTSMPMDTMRFLRAGPLAIPKN